MKPVRLGRNASPLPPMIDDPFDRYGIVGRSRAVADVVRRIQLVSATRSTVLITGETGTGKELVARAVHNRSAERNLPFIKVNCAAIPEALLESELFGHVRGAFTDATGPRKGKFSLAHRGSIFLDEIGTMSAGLQAKLLRVLQEREIDPLGAERTEHVDVRIIAATNRNLRQLVNEGRFQDDLFYRLYVVPIAVPPLRERIEDVPLLVEHFVAKHAMRNGRSIDALEDGVMAWLQEYHWPGNVRELENTIERAVVLTGGPTITRDVITVEAHASAATSGVPSLKLRENVERVECETLRRALEVSPLKRDAARLMGISPRALAYYLAKYPCIDENKTRRAQRPTAPVANCPSTAPRDVANSPGADLGSTSPASFRAVVPADDKTYLPAPLIAAPKITPDATNRVAACGPI
jgi:transcriptional regulator with GAF, ATPase, and Fis domain